MVPVWVAVLGIVGTLAAAVLTQILINRREFRLDQLRWAQERQQRELDAYKAALPEALLAANMWLAHLFGLVTYIGNPDVRRPEVHALAELEAQADRAYVAVDLLCSKEVVNATQSAFNRLMSFSSEVEGLARETDLQRAVNTGWLMDVELHPHRIGKFIASLTEVYRAELAKLAAKPVVLPAKSQRKRFKLLRRKTD